jgi:hypothetical protein
MPRSLFELLGSPEFGRDRFERRRKLSEQRAAVDLSGKGFGVFARANTCCLAGTRDASITGRHEPQMVP